VTEVPEDVRRLAAEREGARRGRDFALADRLRDRIREAGFDVVDTPRGPELSPATAGAPRAEPPVYGRSEDVPSLLDRAPWAECSVQWMVQGWPEDVERGIRSFGAGPDVQHVVVDASDSAAGAWPEDVEVVRFEPAMGWAAARNAGLRRAAGRIVVLVDGSVEATGDVLGPLRSALDDPTVGVTGPFCLVSDDLREFREAGGPEVDAVEGYLMAFRRELVEGGLRFDEKFRFYRTADIELSFQIKAMGLRATVTPVPVERHEHRMWVSTPEEERARLSKRNFYRFLDRWRSRSDLLVSDRT
jgi:GT2 family glycosyltransferase